MNYKERAQRYGVLPPEEKKLYCTKCGAPKHGGECATTVGPPLWFDKADTKPAAAPVLWFDEADTKPKMETPKSPRRNNRARWFLVSAFALLGLGIVRVAMRSNTEDPDIVVPRCFCQQLDTERKVEAQQSQGGDVAGVPTTVWPDIGKVDTCIQTSLGGSLDDADGALQQERHQGALYGDDGVVLCAAAGYSVNETTPEPARPDVMQAARENVCKALAEAKVSPPEESFDQMSVRAEAETKQQIADFAAQMGISKQAAETAINRAAAEMGVTFDCQGGQAAAPPEQ